MIIIIIVNLPWELKKLWKMKVTFVSIVIDDLGTVTKGLVQGQDKLEIKGRVESI